MNEGVPRGLSVARILFPRVLKLAQHTFYLISNVMFDEAGDRMIMRLSFVGRVRELRVNGKWKEKELVKQLWPFPFGWRA